MKYRFSSFRMHVLVGALAAGLLSGCCMGQWCLGGGGAKQEGVPPATNNDDRTSGVDPRTAPPLGK